MVLQRLGQPATNPIKLEWRIFSWSCSASASRRSTLESPRGPASSPGPAAPPARLRGAARARGGRAIHGRPWTVSTALGNLRGCGMRRGRGCGMRRGRGCGMRRGRGCGARRRVRWGGGDAVATVIVCAWAAGRARTSAAGRARTSAAGRARSRWRRWLGRRTRPSDCVSPWRRWLGRRDTSGEMG